MHCRDVDTSPRRFGKSTPASYFRHEHPIYFTSLQLSLKSKRLYHTTGSRNVYLTSKTHFRAYVVCDQPISPQAANDNGWTLSWIGFEPGPSAGNSYLWNALWKRDSGAPRSFMDVKIPTSSLVAAPGTRSHQALVTSIRGEID